MKTPLRLILPVALIATLAGCGNKGPLVHPQSPADEMAVPATTTAPADATMPAPASTAPAAPADVPAPATPTDTTTPQTPPADGSTPPPANGGG
ncbi:hypothetical protein FNZ56_10515 [Pseudoluteimonas lycopersici]|uniref:Sugar transporter n=1 Tax=Pseudoluteimonas lycopersici TaxID=1324796 RepID=A0A516V6Z7_9GAMM|nr:lipoprotein [Lysobacter lycopersici]QDQ74283.1 hypothetical protein FNZ56_10515 [Lysobacter lycopersici]